MYDLKNEAHEFVGESNEEAIAKATSFFGVDREALVVRSESRLEAPADSGAAVPVGNDDGNVGVRHGGPSTGTGC